MVKINKKKDKFSDEDLKGNWSVIFFYPADFSFVCPTELLDLSENYSIFKNLDFTHKVWHESSSAISRNFNVLIEETGLSERGTFKNFNT